MFAAHFHTLSLLSSEASVAETGKPAKRRVTKSRSLSPRTNAGRPHHEAKKLRLRLLGH